METDGLLEPLSILVVEDDEWAREHLLAMLSEERHDIDVANDGEQALAMIRQNVYDLVVTDLFMSPVDGIEVLKTAKAQPHAPEILLVTGHSSVETAVQAMKFGAFDYLTKPLDSSRVRTAIVQVREKKNLKEEVKLLRKQVAEQHRRGEMIAASPGMKRVEAVVQAVARTDTSVLIEGESGTGKELIARAVHYGSQRCDGPFVVINCAALPENLLESELFGYEKGAFTGADRTKKGLFEEADAGSLFLDEIGDMPLQLQVKLLRALQDGEVRHIGSTRTIHVHPRIIAATNKDLRERMAAKLFREDLYYRLRVVPVEVPPLRSRREDIFPLAQHFLKRYSAEDRRVLSGDAIAVLLEYTWPGNVRELENVIRGAIALSSTEIITASAIQLLLQPDFRKEPTAGREPTLDGAYSGGRGGDRQRVTDALRRNHGAILLAAKELGIHRTSLWRKLKKYDIDVAAFRER